MLALLALLGLLLSTVAALPTFDDFGRRSSMSLNSLLPDSSHVRVFARRGHRFEPHDLTLYNTDFPGNLTAIHKAPNPVSFRVYRNSLWVYRNDSAIWPVNFVNATQTPGYPLQVIVGKKQSGVKQGIWYWKDTVLQYDHGAGWHSFYVCPMSNGLMGVFLYTTRAAPMECDAVTFSQMCH